MKPSGLTRNRPHTTAWLSGSAAQTGDLPEFGGETVLRFEVDSETLQVMNLSERSCEIHYKCLSDEVFSDEDAVFDVSQIPGCARIWLTGLRVCLRSRRAKASCKTMGTIALFRFRSVPRWLASR